MTSRLKVFGMLPNGLCIKHTLQLYDLMTKLALLKARMRLLQASRYVLI